MSNVVVIGAGIAGLACAQRLHSTRPDLDVTVLEASGRVGGKIHTVEFAGFQVDLGADSFLARVPDAVRFAEEVGCAHEMVSPTERSAFVWSRGALHPLPAGPVLGLPSSFEDLENSGLLSAEGLAKAAKGYSEPCVESPSVGGVLRARFGDEFVDRFAAPLLGGIYAGDIDSYEIETAAPHLAGIGEREIPLSFGPRTQEPIFFSFAGGLGHLAEKTASVLGQAIRLNAYVDEIHKQQRFRVRSTLGESQADALVVAAPSGAAAAMLSEQFPDLASELEAIAYADVAMTVLSIDPKRMPSLPSGSGFLVPSVEERFITACSWSSKKWAHLANDSRFILRCSAGSVGDEKHKQMSDDQIISAVIGDLKEMIGLTVEPTEALVVRWSKAIPQYEIGHAERLRRIQSHLDQMPGLFLCGAAYEGVGVASCIAGGRRTADGVSEMLS